MTTEAQKTVLLIRALQTRPWCIFVKNEHNLLSHVFQRFMARFWWSARIDLITYANEFVYGAVPRVFGKVLFVAYFRGVSLLEVMRVYDWSNL